MLPSKPFLRQRLRKVIVDKERQGHVVDGLVDRLEALADSYEALTAFAEELADLPQRPDWLYDEPDDFAAIRAASDPQRSRGPLRQVDPVAIAARIESAFLASVCGCQLGKAIETDPDLAELQRAGEAVGQWPIADYVDEAFLDQLGRRHWSWSETVRGRLRYAAADDDINYSVLGMLLLEEHGADFSKRDLLRCWAVNLPVRWCCGPERTFALRAALDLLGDQVDIEHQVRVLNPGEECCGALIRADAYGYACPGDPERASELAWRDASCTHRRTGVYGTMYAAAAISAAFVVDDPLEIFAIAQRYVPQRSRFFAIVSDSLEQVRAARDWLDGYQRIHSRYGEYSHCSVFQECGTLINTLRFAEDIGDGICKQVMQGNDTDSFGATAGSLLGAFFGPGRLDARWLAPFHDQLRTTVARLYEPSLRAVAARMGRLPQRLAQGRPTLAEAEPGSIGMPPRSAGRPRMC